MWMQSVGSLLKKEYVQTDQVYVLAIEIGLRSSREAGHRHCLQFRQMTNENGLQEKESLPILREMNHVAKSCC